MVNRFILNELSYFGALATSGPETFHTDNLNGLYYNNTPQVTGSKIYTLKIGADKWRLGIGK